MELKKTIWATLSGATWRCLKGVGRGTREKGCRERTPIQECQLSGLDKHWILNLDALSQGVEGAYSTSAPGTGSQIVGHGHAVEIISATLQRRQLPSRFGDRLETARTSLVGDRILGCLVSCMRVYHDA
jgi:hypothetical protein